MTNELPGLPPIAFDEWLRTELPEYVGDGDWDAELISGGLSNITYRVHLSTGAIIVRRPPLGELLPSAHDMSREYRVLGSLATTPVPVPQVLNFCTDPQVLGQPFYVMAEVPGVVLRSADDTAALTATERASSTESFIETLAELHTLEPDAVGLGDYGRPEGYCSRQIRRWGEQWARSNTRPLPDMDALLVGLADAVPASQRTSIVHGDYRLDNMIVCPSNSYRVAAVLDWELSTLGDPLADLGMTLTYWHDVGDTERAEIPVAAGITAHDGFPTGRELAETYSRLTGIDLDNLAFYLAFGAMKLAVILEGVNSRYLAGQTVGKGYDKAGQAVPVLVSRGLRHLKERLVAKGLVNVRTETVTHSALRVIELADGGPPFALITLDNGLDRPATFGPIGLDELTQATDAALAAGVVGIAITGAGKVFCAGADVPIFAAFTSREEAVELGRRGHRVFGRLAHLPVPTFAFVNGIALGGGLELALNCTYRTAAENARPLGLPEISLGLVPGWGGTWLLPNLVGIDAALQVIIDAPTAGRTFSGPQLLKLGAVDAVFAPDGFVEASLEWAGRVLQGEQVVTRTPVHRDETHWQTAIERAQSSVDARLHGASLAPAKALDLLAQARTLARDEAFAAEDEALADMAMSDECHAALYAFDLTRSRGRRPTGAPDPALAQSVRSVGIVGAGLMASQLAMLFATGLGVPVVLTDVDQSRVDQGLASVRAQAEALHSKGRISGDDAAQLIASVTGSVDKAALGEADLVIEAIFENLDVKIAMLADLEPLLRHDCVIATNTSSLSVSGMAAVLQNRSRFVGMHFFNPVARMKLLEIVSTASTDEATLATAFAVGKKLGKSCVLVKDAPGFVVNRLLARLYAELMISVDEGTPLQVADHALDRLGLPMSPFALLSLIGPAVLLHLGESMAAAWPDRFPVSPNMHAIVASGVRAVFSKDDPTQVAPELKPLLRQGENPSDQDQVFARVRDALADEAWRMLDDGVVLNPEDLDLCMLLGAGWPAHLGGITPWLDRTRAATDRRFLSAGIASVGH